MQSTQLAQFPEARAGQLIGPMGQFTIDGRGVAEVALNGGLFACVGSADGQRKLPTTANEVTVTGVGFVCLDTTKGNQEDGVEYEIGDAVPLVEQGPGIVVQSAEQMAKGDNVYVIHAVTNRGKVRNDADTANAALLAGCVVKRALSATLCVVARVGYAVQGATGATGPTGPTGPTG